MDGNRRWAREHGNDELEGHAAGTEALRGIVRRAAAVGIQHLTVYAFSRENWSRTDGEISGLFALLATTIEQETAQLIENGVTVSFLGRIEELPQETAARVAAACAKTLGGNRLQLHVAFNYSSRTEIVDAVRAIVRSGGSAESIDETSVASHLYTVGIPDPDLVIRTGGEERLSNFLLWQSAYAEIVTWPGLWPDFTGEDLDAALLTYAGRVRRFGR
jgi:undecaprenyl diphosphate synthase